MVLVANLHEAIKHQVAASAGAVDVAAARGEAIRSKANSHGGPQQGKAGD